MIHNWREPWDGVSWRSTACLVIVFLLNGMMAPFALFAAAVGYEQAIMQFAAMTSVLTVLAMLTRVHGRTSTALRAAAVIANAGVLAVAAVMWRSAAALDHELLPAADVTFLVIIGAANISMLLVSPRIHTSRQISLCLHCGYDLSASPARSCPECGWRPEGAPA